MICTWKFFGGVCGRTLKSHALSSFYFFSTACSWGQMPLLRHNILKGCLCKCSLAHCFPCAAKGTAVTWFQSWHTSKTHSPLTATKPVCRGGKDLTLNELFLSINVVGVVVNRALVKSSFPEFVKCIFNQRISSTSHK